MDVFIVVVPFVTRVMLSITMNCLSFYNISQNCLNSKSDSGRQQGGPTGWMASYALRSYETLTIGVLVVVIARLLVGMS